MKAKYKKAIKFPKSVPRELLVGYGAFEIIYCSELDDEHSIDSFHYGITDFAERKIYILITDDDRCNRETLHHELLHVCFASAGYQDGARLEEEEAVTAFSQQLFILERMNPELFDWIWGRTDGC